MSAETNAAVNDAANPSLVASLSPEAVENLKSAFLTGMRTEMKAAAKEAVAEEVAAKPTRSPVDITKNGANVDANEDVDMLMCEALKHVIFKGRYAESADTKAEEVFRQVHAIAPKVLSAKGLRTIKKDMTSGGAGVGAELVAVQYNREAIVARLNLAPVLGELYPVDLGGEKSANLPKYIGRPTAYMVGENSNITQSGVTTDDVTFTAKKVAVLSAPIASELLMFSRTPFLADVVRFGQEAIILKKRAQVTLGAGNSTNAQGFDKIDSGREVAFVGSALDWPHAYDLIHGVEPQYRIGAKFGMTDATIKVFRQIKGTDGHPVLSPPTGPDQPYNLGRYPVLEMPDIEGAGTASSPARIYFGLWSAFYGLATSGGQRVDQTNSANNNFNYDTVQVRLIEMFDGEILLDEAMCFMDVEY